MDTPRLLQSVRQDSMGNEQEPPRRIYRLDEQEIVMFHGHPIIAVRLDDGRIVVTIQSLAEGMRLQVQAQVKRADRTEALAGAVLRPWLETEDAGPQERPSLLLNVLPGWLLGVDTHRLTGERHDTILAYQQDAYAVLYDHFVASRLRALPPAHTAVAPVTPAPDASIDERIAYHEAMATYLHWQQDVEAWRASTDARLDTVEGQVNEIAAIIPDIVARLGEQGLTAAHLADVQQGVNIIHDGQGLSHERVYGELHQAFHVGRYDQIPERRWPDVVAWFRPRTAAARDAGQRKGRKAQHDPFADDGPEQGSLF